MLEGDSDMVCWVLRRPLDAIVAVNPDLKKMCQDQRPGRL
jgi:hypothetical protein